MLDEHDLTRWIATARHQLAVAEHSSGGGFHDAAVLHAEQAAQCALKALRHAVGARSDSRSHALPRLAEGAYARGGLQLDAGLRERLGELAAQYQPTRYPDALADGTPADHYGPQAAHRAIETARQTIAEVVEHAERLREASEEEPS
ncbi:HEPN domain-containing protein [Egibacter rhizosphaerae]|uniref:HEPN domain-containing protein n=1 Tax=Egibacter rhizosphaerae TaxID=1670831 RepID=A0A411YHS7_9ACTN|nr:HEPN domain-containing protein [Egibacter rhizosphaerae]QBI20885.1 HEPN domain-containing protein [Egibacter rhizosphaerae]